MEIVKENTKPYIKWTHSADLIKVNQPLRTVPTNSKVFLPRFMIMQEM